MNLIFVGTRQNLYFGCAGFLLGGLIGFGIGIAMYKQQSYVRYMQAIQCIDYQGPNVCSILKTHYFLLTPMLLGSCCC